VDWDNRTEKGNETRKIREKRLFIEGFKGYRRTLTAMNGFQELLKTAP
jgi:hypothetical protein